MDTAQFLARVIAPGNYIAVGFNTPSKPNSFGHRFFTSEQQGQIPGFLKWAVSKGMDAYHAMASYTFAEANGHDNFGNVKFRGERTQGNAQRLRAFWVDLDVTRAGDKKRPGQTFATQADAISWLAAFVAKVRLLRPNIVVNSGYGLHAYWVLADPLLTADWQPYADALKAALIQHGFVGDAGISADAARVLRPPGTANQKAGTPVPVSVIAPLTVAGDYPNNLILGALQPYVGILSKPALQVTSVQVVGGQQSALAGGGGGTVQAIFANQPQHNMNQAAQSGVTPQARPREFARIAVECDQVKLSLSNHGNGDSYPLWYLGHLSLAFHTVDGAAFVTPISDGDPRFTVAGTTSAWQRIAREHQRKGHGPPGCAHFERARPGVCAMCPHFGKVHSPWDLGVEDGDLPDHYRRNKGAIEVETRTKDGWIWHQLVAGDVQTPILDELPYGGYTITFDYVRAGKTRAVRAQDVQLKPDSSAIFALFAPQGVTLLGNTMLPWRDFVLGWIDKLRAQRAERTETIYPFGWAKDAAGEHAGFAVGGTLYRPDGREEATPGGDPQLVNTYRPRGDLAKWKQATEFVTKDRMDLQLLVAAAFGAPLMPFTGHSGLVISAWSRQSAVGKSSGIKCGQSVWSGSSSMNSVDDTNNFVLKKVADVRAMPCYWDEMKVGSENSDKMVSLALSLSQGKGKGRLNADSSMKEVGEWDTILISASNFPLMDHIISKTDGTDAGAVRLFEFSIAEPSKEDTSHAARIIALTKTNYGLAGRVYAQYIATHYDLVDKIVCVTKDMLGKELKSEQCERFYIAGMAVCLAGAKLSNHLGLTQFDVEKLKAFLCTEFMRMRRARTTAVMVSSTGYDLEQMLGTFMADNQRHKVVTQWIAQPGGNRKLPADFIKWYPQDRNRVDVQVGQNDKVLRISRNVFQDWCHKRNYASSDVITCLGQLWGATMGRKTIAAGTGFGGGQVYCIDIPLSAPELQDYLYVDPTSSPPPGPASPATKLKGNQPKVV